MWLAMIEAAAGRPCPEAGGGMRGMFETMFLTMLCPALCPPLIITGRPGKIIHVSQQLQNIISAGNIQGSSSFMEIFAKLFQSFNKNILF